MARLWVLRFLAAVSLLSAPAWPAQDNPNARVEIDRIDITGVKVFSNQVIEGALEVSPGDPLERQKVVRTEENLQSLYLSRGFDEVRIRSRLVRKKDKTKGFETVLEFEIKEGRPIRVSSVRVVPEGAPGGVALRDWKVREQKILDSIALAPGDILDQEKISDGKRAIQEILGSAEYVGTKVDDVRVATSAPLGLPMGGDDKEASRWVSVEFHVDLGDKVTFGFRGNTVFTRGNLNSIVDEQRVIGLGKDYVGAIKARIEDEYRSAGYAKIEITPYTMGGSSGEGRKVTYLIKEGPLVRIRSVDFDGNFVFSSSELREQFFNKAPALVKNGIYVEKDVQKSAELLMEWLKEKGYLSSKLITIGSYYLPKTRTQQTSNAVRLLVYLYEGDQTLVDKISFSGISLLKEGELKKILKVQEGAPLNLFALGDGIEALKRIYFNRGYLGFRILNENTDTLVTYTQENHLASILIEADEGPQYTVSRIEIEGLKITKEPVVRRELTFEISKVLSDSQMVESERNLRRLGIFSGVAIRANDDPNDSNAKIVRVSLQEADRGILTWGPGLRNDLGIRLFGQLAYTNLWGENHTALVNVAANRRFYLYHFVEAQGTFAYIWPWFVFKDMTFRPSISAARTQYINFSAGTVTASLAWDKQILSHLTGSLSYNLENINQFNATDEVNNNQLMIGSITPRLSLDMRDSSLVPTSGFFSTVWLDLALPGLLTDSDVGYYRFQFRADYHLPLFWDIIWYFSFRTGYERNFASSKTDPRAPSNIPLIKQFALGGIGSLRGYQEQELNYQVTRITDRLTYVNYRTQIDMPFAGALKFGVFADAANLLVNKYSLGGLRYGVGFGFHYRTPVGPVNLDWGFKIDPPPGTDAYVIHFSVGVI